MERALLQIMQAAQLLELQMQSEGRAPMTQDQMSQMWNTQVGGAVAKITAAANTQFKVTEQEIELFANMHENDMEVKQQITNSPLQIVGTSFMTFQSTSFCLELENCIFFN